MTRRMEKGTIPVICRNCHGTFLVEPFALARAKYCNRLCQTQAIAARRHYSAPVNVSFDLWQMLLGCALGDSHIKRVGAEKACMFFGHVITDEEYLVHKHKALAEIGLAGRMRLYNSPTRFSKRPLVRFETPAHPLFHKLHESIYLNGKKHLSDQLLNTLTPIAFAYWFQDDGSYWLRRGRYHQVQLCLNGFPWEEADLVPKYLQRWNMRTHLERDRGTPRLVISNKESVLEWFRLVSPFCILTRKLPTSLQR